MTALRTRVLLALVAAGAAITMAACSQEARVPVPKASTPAATTVVETLSPIPNAPTTPPPAEPAWTPPPVAETWTPSPEPEPWAPTIDPERVLQYCEDGTGIYGLDDYVLNDPSCYTYQEGPGNNAGEVWTDADGTWVYICSGAEDPRPEAECTIPAN